MSALTPKDVILSRGTMQLYHYRPQADEVYRVPVLLVMATTNRAYVFDLAPGQSMVEYLLKAGYDVFVLDWDPPLPEERRLTLTDYTQDSFLTVSARSRRIRVNPIYPLSVIVWVVFFPSSTHRPILTDLSKT